MKGRERKQTASASAEKMWSAELTKHKPLDRETTLELFQARDEATEEQRTKIDALILEGNLRLVMKIARVYDRAHDKLLDLCQEGAGGVLRAIEKYDWRRGVSFPTYATWWIRQAISHCARSSGKNVRLPAHAASALRELGASETGGVAPKKKASAVVLEAVKHARREVSLSAPAHRSQSGDRQATVGDSIPDVSPNPEEALGNRELRAAVAAGVRELSEPELIALRMRFGLADEAAP